MQVGNGLLNFLPLFYCFYSI